MIKHPSKNKFQREVEIFLANAVDPEIQAVLEKGGCNLAFIAKGQKMLESWVEAQGQAARLEAAQKKATKTQWAAHDLANKEMVWLSSLVRSEFGHNEPLLTLLGLWTPPHSSGEQSTTNGSQGATNASVPKTNDSPTPDSSEADSKDSEATPPAPTPATHETSPNPEAEGKKRAAPKGKHALATDIARWRRLCRGVSALSEEEQAQLAEVGWAPPQINIATARVEAVAEANNAQKKAIQAKQAGVAEANAHEQNLRQWHRSAKRMAKGVTSHYDPEDRNRWLKQLGM